MWRERSRLVRLHRLWLTRHPRTFTEKVRYKMLRDRRPLVVVFADKAAVRDYVADVVGEQHLPQLHLLTDDPHTLADVRLPEACVVKPTHGSGAALIISGAAEPDARLPPPSAAWGYFHVRPEAALPAGLVALGRAWLDQLYGLGPNREWAYGRIPRRILVEELLVGPDGGLPDDYKLFVFHGVCRYVQVDRGRFGDRTQDFFTRDWERLALSGGLPWAASTIERPHRLEEMVELAERLGSETDFVRVDLYHLADRVVVGELTSYPAAGDSYFDPPSYDEEFGAHWTPPASYGRPAGAAGRSSSAASRVRRVSGLNPFATPHIAAWVRVVTPIFR